LVCFGHTHVAEQQRRGATLVLNPGAVYRARRHSIAIVKLPELDVTDVAI
jgi:predicted phosphodiesterase